MSGAVLILADQPVVAALVGLLVELAGYQPVFAERGEHPVEAIGRVRPRVVVLVDLALDDARSDLFFVQAAKRQLGIALFGPQQRQAELERLALARGVPWFTLPPEKEELARSIEAAATSGWWSRVVERRRPAASSQDPEGALAFLDSQGNRWTVYDRRRVENAQENVSTASGDPGMHSGAVVERLFVSDSGKRRSCELRMSEIEDSNPATLEEQLARALPV